MIFNTDSMIDEGESLLSSAPAKNGGGDKGMIGIFTGVVTVDWSIISSCITDLFTTLATKLDWLLSNRRHGISPEGRR